ncbi:MAG: hypothetical protein Q4B26_03770 [Eubacteriales bacterium]|nr:hypothetical protein [Eubacteriales bacterium]
MKTIRLLRFMGFAEMLQYLEGRKLVNNTVWRENHSRTSSVGFCFFEDTEEETPEERLDYLRGVVHLEVVAVFQANKNDLKKGIGKYRDPEKDDALSVMQLWSPTQSQVKEEYSAKMYSKDNFYLLKLGWIKDPLKDEIEWIWSRGMPISVEKAFSRVMEERGMSVYEEYIRRR